MTRIRRIAIKRLGNRHKVVFTTVSVTAAVLFLLVMLPGYFATVNSQSGWGPIHNQASLKGTNLTYYPGSTAKQCQADCGNNARCKGFTLIRAGAYNRNDPPMCYLASEVTDVVPHSCCISAVKSGGGGSGALTGDWDIRCCDDGHHWILSIRNQKGSAFSGSFSTNDSGGAISGQVRGSSIAFTRTLDNGTKQNWSAQIVSEGGRFRMINGTWTGAYSERYSGRNNWHAEKK